VADDTVKFIYDDDIQEIIQEAVGDLIAIRRASYIEPSARTPGHWEADMEPTAGIPCMLGPFPTRRAALAAEHAFLEAYLGGTPIDQCLTAAEEASRTV